MSLLDNPTDIIYVSGSVLDTETVIVVQDQLLSSVESVNGQIGHVVIDTGKFITGVDLSSYATIVNLALTGSNLQNQINNLDLDYASQTEINTLSGNLSITGSNLQSQINNLYNSGFITGVDLSPYYLKSNPSGFITGIDLSTYATISNLQLTGQNLQNQINNLDLNYASDLQLSQTGANLQLQLDNKYPSSNPSGFITGIDLSSYATLINLAATGQNLNEKINTLSGSVVLVYGDQTIYGTKYFNNSVYIHDLYVTGTEFIANVQNNFIESPYILLNLTGGAIDGGVFFVTGTGLTGINDYGPIIGFDHSNKFKFGIARRSDDLSLLNDIAAVQDITNYSGFVNSNFYLSSNPSGFITGVDLSQYLTGVDLSPYVTKVSGEFLDRPTVNGTGVLLSGEAAGTANFRYAPVTGVYNLLSNNRYSFDTLTGLVTGILPANPQKGDEVELYDSAGTWHLNPLIVDNNGNYIEQKKDQLQCNVRHGLIKLIYTTQNNIGWRIYPMPIHNIPLFLPPSIAITGAALSGIIPFYIALTGINLLDPAQAPVDEWYWNLNTGDGYTTSGQTIAYTYLQTGLYDVTLSGSNAAGFDVEHRFINVFLPYVPTVSVTSNKLSGIAPFTGQLSATNTTQPAEYSPVDNWYWDFDGDQAFDFTGQNATVVYNQTGTYNPTAYAVNLGGTGSGFITINVIEPLVPIPAIATYTASGYAPLTIQFSGVNLQTPEEFSPVDHWYWNLSGDSAPEFDQRVISYTFNETGTYTFYLTAANSAGSGVASGIVTVLELPPLGPSGTDPYSDYVVLLMNFNT